MATATEIKQLKNRSEQVGVLPYEGLQLARLPKSITRAFPEMIEWEKQNDIKVADFVKKLNTANSGNNTV
jgi:hypothetical protein